MATPQPNQLHQFSADLDAFAKQIKASLDVVVRRAAVDLHDRIVRRTPVDTGRARASWSMSLDTIQGAGDVGSGTTSTVPVVNPAVLADLKRDPYRVVWIFNNVNYILALENGHSKQAPAGMVAISREEVEGEIDRLMGRAP